MWILAARHSARPTWGRNLFISAYVGDTKKCRESEVVPCLSRCFSVKPSHTLDSYALAQVVSNVCIQVYTYMYTSV